MFGKPVFRTNLSRLPWVGIDRAVSYLESHLPLLLSALLCAVICTLRSPAGPSGPSCHHLLGRVSDTGPILTRYLHHWVPTTSTESGLVVGLAIDISQSVLHQRSHCVLCGNQRRNCVLLYHGHNRRVVYRHDWHNPYPTARDSWISLDFTLFVILITIVITIVIVPKLIISKMRQKV